MQKFPSIEAFRSVIRAVRENSAYHGKPIPTVEFEGTVKLHGTNAGVRINADETVQAQSRERLITIEQDNAGFAHFAAMNSNFFVSLARTIAIATAGSITEAADYGRYTIYGEWCGGNIQSKVGLNTVKKHFVIFNVYDHVEERLLNREWMDFLVNEDNSGTVEVYNASGIYFIYQIPTFKMTIDFAQPEQYIEELERLTLNVEESCPWATFMGGSGIGEGIVWVPTEREHSPISKLWFKTKGVKHQGKGESKVKTLSVDPVKVAAIRELVDVLTPEWRMEQGVTYLRENGYTLDQKATGQYLQWVMKDILKEESDTIAANPYTWKELTGYITTKARDYYFTALDKAAMA